MDAVAVKVFLCKQPNYDCNYFFTMFALFCFYDDDDDDKLVFVRPNPKDKSSLLVIMSHSNKNNKDS